MEAHSELGIGLAIGIAFGVVLALAFRFWRAQLRMRKSEPAAVRTAKQILEEFETFSVILDETATLIYANQAAREYDGSTDLDRRLRSPKMQATVMRVLATGESVVKNPSDPASPGAIRFRIFPLDDYHVVLAGVDVGEQQRVFAMRRDFIANMSHELKTPIAAIGLLSEAIVEGADDPRTVLEFARKLQGESERLNELTKNVIRLSEAQASLSSEDIEPVDLRRLAQDEVTSLEEFAANNAVSLVFTDSTAGRSEAELTGRAAALRSAVSNLLTNAIAHSPKGGTVYVSLRHLDGECLLAVRDEGPGIDVQYHSRIFERFFRVDPARSRSLGGTGLGLSIVRNTMLAHGGSVSVESSPGNGATFTLRLPLAMSPSMREKKRSRKQRVDRARKQGQ